VQGGTAAPAQKRKQCLVLDRDKFRYQKFISDISGQDIHSHNNSVEELIFEVRDFLRTNGSHISGGRKIHTDYLRFDEEKPALCEALDLDPRKLTFKDLTYVTAEWLARSPR
jgi:hypothetical protein